MKKRIVRWLKNKYILATTIFVVWVSFFNDIDLFYIAESRWELGGLEQEVADLKRKNAEAREALEDLSHNTASLEKFAREQYYMKRDNEEVFVFKERAD